MRKTAWSNTGIVGARLSVLLDNREWQEGVVTAYRKPRKHCVDFHQIGEKRWLNLLELVFYIIERSALPSVMGGGGSECKEADPDLPEAGLALVEPWAYCEDISLNFCRAQSVLHKVYGGKVQETGHKTVGHLCVTQEDIVSAKEANGNLLYGELLPRGVNKAMDAAHLHAAGASVLYDLGMGTGKVAMQAFLQFPNLAHVYGVELSRGRYVVGESAVLALAKIEAEDFEILEHTPGRRIVLSSRSGRPERRLEMECGNLLDIKRIEQADIVLLETDMPVKCFGRLDDLLHRMKTGAKALTYLDLKKTWVAPPFPFSRMAVNISFCDRFATSWSVNRGHHFFLWSKGVRPPTRSSGTMTATAGPWQRLPSGTPPFDEKIPTATSRGGSRFFACLSLPRAAHGGKKPEGREVIERADDPDWDGTFTASHETHEIEPPRVDNRATTTTPSTVLATEEPFNGACNVC